MGFYLKGFGLLELLVSLAISALVLLGCLPSLFAFYERNEVDAIAETIKNAIPYVRNQVLGKGLPLALNPGAKQDWSYGMILFLDNPKHLYGEKDHIIRQWFWPGKSVQVQWRGFRSRDYLAFANNLHSSSLNGQFVIKGKRNYQRKLIINRLGHIREDKNAIRM